MTPDTTSADRTVERADVVIVGARCAGAATALLLARRGLHVVVLDRMRPGSDALSTHALMRAGVLQLHRWGLLDAVRDAGTPAVRRTVFRYGRDTTSVTLKPVAGVDALYAPRRTVLDPILVEAAVAAGAEFRFGTTVTGIERDGDGRVTGVMATSPAREPFIVRADTTVGADGLHSRIAAAVRAPLERLAATAGAVIYGHVPGLDAVGYEWFYRTGVTAGIIPTNDDAACVFVGTGNERFRTDLAHDIPGAFTSLLRDASPEAAERVAAAGAIAQYRTFPGVKGFLRRPWGPGWALVGDAGHFKDPLSTHGISDALRDAELLADAIVAGRIRAADAPAAMAGYQRTRNRLSDHLFTTTEAIASYRWDTASAERLVRSLAASMTDEVTFLTGLDERPQARVAS